MKKKTKKHVSKRLKFIGKIAKHGRSTGIIVAVDPDLIVPFGDYLLMGVTDGANSLVKQTAFQHTPYNKKNYPKGIIWVTEQELVNP